MLATGDSAAGGTEVAQSIELLTPFDLACRRAGLTHDQVARMMEIKPEQLYQQLRLQGHFSLTRLLKLRDHKEGRKFLFHYWPLVAQDMGIPEVAHKLAIADAFQVFIDTLQVRMARADLAAVEREQKTA